MHSCHSSLPFEVAVFAMKLLAVHRDLMKFQVAPPSRVSSISPTASLDTNSPALPKGIASVGLKFTGKACGDDHVRPASTLVRTSYGQLTPFAHGYVTSHACRPRPVTNAMKVWPRLTGLHVCPES